MADPISIVGLIGTSLQLIQTVKDLVKFARDVRGAPTEIIQLGGELDRLQLVVTQLEKLLKLDQGVQVSRTSALYQAAGDFVIMLAELRSKLERSSNWRGGLGRAMSLLQWPLQKTEIRVQIDSLHKYLQIFQFSINLEGLEMLRQTRDLVDSRAGAHVTESLSSISEFSNADLMNTITKFQTSSDLNRLQEQRETDLKEVLTTFSTLDFRAKQADNFGKHHPNTYSEFLENHRFTEWFESSNCFVLWCPGNPGAGKSVLTSIAIDHALVRTLEANIAVVYIYCDYKDSNTHTASALLASMVQQLVLQTTHSERIQDLKAFQNAIQRKHRKIAEHELFDILKGVLEDFDRVYVFIDALDELPEVARDHFIDHLARAQSQISLMITTRPHIDFTSRFDPCIRLPIVASVSDVQDYMRSEIRRSSRLMQFIGQDPPLEDEIIEGVNRMTSGIFLLAHLQILALSRQTSANRVRMALGKPPTVVLEQYSESIRRIQNQDGPDTELALKLLSLIHCANRPLTRDEVCHALAIEPGETRFEERALPDLKIALGVSAGLVSVVTNAAGPTSKAGENIETLRLVHATLSEYLEANSPQLFSAPQLDLAEKCLTYLSYEDIRDYLLDAQQNTTPASLRSRLPFLEYAVMHWGVHAKGFEKELLSQISVFLRREAPNINSLISLDTPPNAPLQADLDSYPGMYAINPLITATVLDLRLVLQDLLGSYDVNSRDSKGRTALHFAVSWSNLAVVKQLLAAGADPNVLDQCGHSPLFWASSNSDSRYSELLIEGGGVVGASDAVRDSPVLPVPSGTETTLRMAQKQATMHSHSC